MKIDITALALARNWILLRRGLERKAKICLLFTQTGVSGRFISRWAIFVIFE